jgi:hypothetical protein
LKLDDKILSNDIGELDDLLTADVMSDVIEESTKETLEVEPENGGLGSSGKASGASTSKPDKSTTTKGMYWSNDAPTLSKILCGLWIPCLLSLRTGFTSFIYSCLIVCEKSASSLTLSNCRPLLLLYSIK